MSSTNRGYSRHTSDYYVTPVEEIKKFLGAWLQDEQENNDYWLDLSQHPDKLSWLDPCAGGDDKNPMSYPEALKDIGVTPETLDIRQDSRANIKSDYLKEDFVGLDVIITNPPFYLAQEIIEKALAEADYVVMLLRLNFLGSKRRLEFWQNHPPKYIYVHHKRMSFTAGGGTDSIEYAHFVWHRAEKPEKAMLEII